MSHPQPWTMSEWQSFFANPSNGRLTYARLVWPDQPESDRQGIFDYSSHVLDALNHGAEVWWLTTEISPHKSITWDRYGHRSDTPLDVVLGHLWDAMWDRLWLGRPAPDPVAVEKTRQRAIQEVRESIETQYIPDYHLKVAESAMQGWIWGCVLNEVYPL